jgi:sulfur relay (sulfurtransferase) complex TusBCD TusD component (DsrE family)
VLQFAVSNRRGSVSDGQAAPNLSGSVLIPLVRVVVPPPHVAEQVDHADQLSSNTQSTGHGVVLQFSVSNRSGSVTAGQAAPPLAGGVLIPLVLVLVPPPHVAEQVDQADQLSSNTQSTGQTKVKSFLLSPDKPVTVITAEYVPAIIFGSLVLIIVREPSVVVETPYVATTVVPCFIVIIT